MDSPWTYGGQKSPGNERPKTWMERLGEEKNDRIGQKMASKNINMTQEVKLFDTDMEKKLLQNQRIMEGDMDTENTSRPLGLE